MTTGEKITAERNKLGLTQQQFAEEMGVTRQAVSRWEGDISFPETEKLAKMSRLFGCSIDYLIKYGAERGGGESRKTEEDGGTRICSGFNPFNWSFEYKSKKTVCGLPLVHINIGLGRRAKGIFSLGIISSGIFSFGVLSAGVFSFGCLSLGLLSLGCLSLGALALGAVAAGLLAFGGVAFCIIAFGGAAFGCFGFGGYASGLFAVGGYAEGYYVAVGDYACAQLAFGKTTAVGSALQVNAETFESQSQRAFAFMDGLPQFWSGFIKICKTYAVKFMA